jgi:hypothetical protein
MRSRRIAGPLFLLLIVASFGMWLHGAVPDVPTGQWLPGPALAQPRAGAVSVALDDGRVLVIGGRTASGPVDTVEVFNTNGTMSLGAQMRSPRSGHTATKLPDGNVLVVGGTTMVTTDHGSGPVSAEAVTNSAEVYDVSAGVWYPGSSLSTPRTGHTATAVLDGRVLLAGGAGDTGAALDTFEVFNPESGVFSSAGLLSAARTGHAAAVAGKTKVVVAGGQNANGVLATADVIDLETGTVSGLMLNSARAGASATTLLDGKILVAGGSDGANDLASAEVINPATGLSTSTGSMAQPRRGHGALLLENNNTVLIAGGTNGGAVVTTAEQFIPWSGAFSLTGSPADSRRSPILSSVWKDGTAWLAAGRGADGTLALGTELYGFAAIRMNKADYQPGNVAYVSGSGWQPGETVTFALRELPAEHASRFFPIDTDPVTGEIPWTKLFDVEEHHLGVRFYLTARGAASQAQITFTDSNSFNVTPLNQSVTAGSTNTFIWTFAAQNAGNQQTTTLTIPTGWTAPQVGPGPGQVTVTPGTCAASLGSVSGMVITIDQGPGTNTCAQDGTFTLTYSNATAPTPASPPQSYTFTNQHGQDPIVTVTAAVAPTKLAFTTAPFNGVVNQCLGPIAIQTQNNSSTATNATSNTPVSLATNGTGQFYASGDTTCSGSVVSSLTIASGSSSGSFRYKPTVRGSGAHLLTVSATGLTSASQTQTVSKADQTITFVALPSRTYGDAPFTVSASASSGLAVSFAASGNCTLSGNAVTITGAGTCTITGSQAGDGDYNAAPAVPQTFSIGKASASIVVTGYTGVYDGLAHGATGTATGVGGESLAGLNLGASFTNVPGGTATWVFTDVTGNYNDATGTAAIVLSKANATIVVDGFTGVYDGAAHGATGTATGVGGAALAGLDLGVSFTNVPGGTATWVFTDVTGNYNDATGTAAIVLSKANATIVVDGFTGVYDGAARGATGTATAVGGAALAGLDLGASFTNVPGGTATWVFTDVTGNYNDATGTAAIVINKKPTTGNFTTDNKVYDGGISASVLTRTIAGVIAGDDVSLTAGTATFSDKNVANGKTVNLTGATLTGAQAGNYSLTSVNTTTGNITPKSIVGNFTASHKVYDGTTSATVTGRTVVPIVGDTLSLTDGTATFGDKNVGTGKTVTLAGAALAGSDAANYSLASVNTTTANITAAPLTITASSPADMLLHGPVPTITPAYTGFVTGDNANSLAPQPTCSTTYTVTSAVGTYTTSCTGAAATNYIITTVGGSFKVLFLWDGFLQPINDTAHDVHTTAPFSKFKLGQTIPAKFDLKDANGNAVTQTGNPTFNYTRIGASCTEYVQSETLELAYTPSSVPVFVLSGGHYQYNWSTKGLQVGLYSIYANLADGTSRTVNVCFAK